MGGVSDSFWKVAIWSRLGLPNDFILSEQPKRVLLLVLKGCAVGNPIQLLGGGVGNKATTAVTVRPNTYAPWGLYPVTTGGMQLVVVPSVFSQTGHVKRRLTVDELGAIWDVPIIESSRICAVRCHAKFFTWPRKQCQVGFEVCVRLQ